MAFPVTGILDTFDRANAGTLGANWTTNVEGLATSGHQIVSNAAVPLGNFASSWWNVATVGPDCESRITVTTKPGNGFAIRAFARLQSPGSAACDGYAASISVNAGTDTMAIYRLDNGLYTQLGAAVTEERSNGDALGLECIGTTQKGFIGTTEKLSRTGDATYAGAGYIGFEGDQSGAGVYNDFGGGTISSGQALAGNLTPGLDFSGELSPPDALAGNLTPGLDFSGNVTLGTFLGGGITEDLAFSGNAEFIPLEMAGTITPGLAFSGTATGGSTPGSTALSGGLAIDLAFSAVLAGASEAWGTPSDPIEITVDGFASGLVGVIGITIEAIGGGVLQPRTTAGIIEEPGAAGTYTATLTAPGATGTYLAVWDDGGAPVSEYLVVADPLPPTHPYQVGAAAVATLSTEAFPTGLVSVLGLRINDGQGATVTPRSVADISETGPGVYTATRTAPGIAGSYVAIWDDGAGDTAFETFLVAAPLSPSPAVLPRYGSGPLPWMVFGGVEIGNAARTLAYLGNRYDAQSNPQGLAGIYNGWRLGNGDCCFCPVLATDGAGVEVDFLRPDDIGVSVGDPAPWYDPAVPESAQFLGALITQITGLDSTVGRAKTERAAGLGGAALGAQRAGGREIAVRATLVATSCPGLDYGRRWLSHALANDLCDDCETYQLELRTTCPPDDRPDVGLVNIYEVGLSEGPRIIRDGGLPDCCDLLEVEWTLTAGNPLVYACPVEVVPFTPAPDGVTVSGTIDPPEPFGTIAALIEVRTGTVAGQGILVRAWDQLLGDPCPGATDEECLSIQLAGLPDGVVVTIDGARQRLVVTDVAGVESDGLPYVVMSDGEAFDWPEFVGCQRVCVAVSVSADPGPGDPVGAAVAISSQHRFLA